MPQKPLSRDDAQHAIDMLHEHGGNVTYAARAMGIPRKTLVGRLETARRYKLTPSTMRVPTGGPFASGPSYEEQGGALHLSTAGRWMIVSDIHIPFHSEAATDTAFNDAAKQGVRGIILNGDIFDFHWASRFVQDPRHLDAHAERERGVRFLADLRKAFPRAEIVFNEGNHEVRIVHYIMRRPELFNLPELRLENMYRFGEHGIKFADTLTALSLGKLRIIHGHEYRIGAGVVNVARILQQRAGVNAICGHFHRSNEYIKRLADGSVIGAWSTGCLSGLSPYWLPMNEWNHGYALVDVDEDGGFEIQNRTIIRGRVR